MQRNIYTNRHHLKYMASNPGQQSTTILLYLVQIQSHLWHSALNHYLVDSIHSVDYHSVSSYESIHLYTVRTGEISLAILKDDSNYSTICAHSNVVLESYFITHVILLHKKLCNTHHFYTIMGHTSRAIYILLQSKYYTLIPTVQILWPRRPQNPNEYDLEICLLCPT